MLTARKVFISTLPFAALLAAVSVLSLSVGPSGYTIMDGLRGGEPARTIVFGLRLPRLIAGIAAGLGLSSCGVVFQGVLGNPLAEPFVLGVAGGAAAAAALAMLMGAGSLQTGLAAFGGAALTTLLVFGLARRRGELNAGLLLLAGIIANTFFAALIMLATFLAAEERLYSIIFWLYGDLGRPQLAEAALALAVAAGSTALFWFRSHRLNLLAAGADSAADLGLEVGREQVFFYLVASLAVGAIVATCGLIGFVGLIVPHMVRLLLGSDHRLLLPTAAVAGAAFLVGADLVARSLLAPQELPVGVVTAFLGAPLFGLLLKRRGVSW
ncbi:MAG: iron ABC transporter permease [Pseudomonadota bacterium]